MKPAGTFTTWLRRRQWLHREVQAARQKGGPLPSISSSVPCGDCHACCVKYRVEFDAELDNPSAYETETVNGLTVIRHRDDDSCVYLTDGCCSIYQRRPFFCRMYDCRPLAYALLEVDRDDLNEAIQQWNPRGFCKTRDDMILMMAYQLAVRAELRQGKMCEISCRDAFEKIENFTSIAKSMYDKLRIKHDV